MTRIIGGEAGSLRLASAATVTRPTSDRVREALFSRIEAHRELEGACVLDLFAGTGALGLEAASRGASAIWLVDKHRGALQVIRANIATLSTALSREVAFTTIASTVSSFLRSEPTTQADLVFIDPPYDLGDAELNQVLQDLVPWLNSEAWVIVERSSRSSEPDWPAGLDPLPEKTYGDTTLYVAVSGEKGSQPPLS